MPSDNRLHVLVLEDAADANRLRRAVPGADVVAAPTLAETPDAAEADVVVLRSATRLDAAAIASLRALRHVVRAGSGVDNIDVAALRDRGIALHRNPIPGATAVAEWVEAAVLALCRNIPLGHNGLMAGVHLKSACVGRPATGCSVAIWGAGPVGLAVAEVLAPRVRELAFAAWPSNRPSFPQESADVLYERADVHVGTLPLRPATASWFGHEFLARVAPRAPMLICAGRADTVDIGACLQGLRDGELSGLALDALDADHVAGLAGVRDPLNLLVSPHIGAQRSDTREALDAWVADVLLGLVQA